MVCVFLAVCLLFPFLTVFTHTAWFMFFFKSADVFFEWLSCKLRLSHQSWMLVYKKVYFFHSRFVRLQKECIRPIRAWVVEMSSHCCRLCGVTHSVLVSKLSTVWQQGNKNYKDNDFKDNIWKKIGEELSNENGVYIVYGL